MFDTFTFDEVKYLPDDYLVVLRELDIFCLISSSNNKDASKVGLTLINDKRDKKNYNRSYTGDGVIVSIKDLKVLFLDSHHYKKELIRPVNNDADEMINHIKKVLEEKIAILQIEANLDFDPMTVVENALANNLPLPNFSTELKECCLLLHRIRLKEEYNRRARELGAEARKRILETDAILESN